MPELLYVLDITGADWETDAVLRAPSATEASALHDVYADAFSTRPGDCLTAEVWIPKWPLHDLCELGLSRVVESEDGLDGYLLSYLDPERPGEGYIGQVGVRPRARRRGLATKLVRSAVAAYQGLGLTQAALRVAPDNAGAIRVYEALGFTLAEA